MSDDLIKRLRWSADGWDDCENPENAQQDREAADRIEQLETNLFTALIMLSEPIPAKEVCEKTYGYLFNALKENDDG